MREFLRFFFLLFPSSLMFPNAAVRVFVVVACLFVHNGNDDFALLLLLLFIAKCGLNYHRFVVERERRKSAGK